LSTFYFSTVIALFKKILPKKSYSDYGEDLIILNLAPEGQFSYLDIGAGHPIIGSNTYYFYRSRIHGITVEPIKFLSRLHKLIRSRDICINALISDSVESRVFYEFNPMQYSTTSNEQYGSLYALGMRARKIYNVDAVLIASILVQLKNLPYFISIDCEGFDYEILKLIKTDEIKNAFAIIIEMSSDENNIKIFRKMDELGFKLNRRTVKNAIFERAIQV
jgi:FkbM family methyltransferase